MDMLGGFFGKTQITYWGMVTIGSDWTAEGVHKF